MFYQLAYPLSNTAKYQRLYNDRTIAYATPPALRTVNYYAIASPFLLLIDLKLAWIIPIGASRTLAHKSAFSFGFSHTTASSFPCLSEFSPAELGKDCKEEFWIV